jgi:hypothetical protein
VLAPVHHSLVVPRFCREGKSDDARKSRIFNNLGRNPGRATGLHYRDLPQQPIGNDLGMAGRAGLTSLWNEAGL